MPAAALDTVDRGGPRGRRQLLGARYTRPGLAAITTATELLDPPHRRA